MVKTKMWYKQWWVIVIAVIILAGLVIGIGTTGNYIREQNQYSSQQKEYKSLSSKMNETFSSLAQIANKYSKNGASQYNSFTKQDLTEYARLINVGKQNLDDLITWINNNKDYLRHLGRSDSDINVVIGGLNLIKSQLDAELTKVSLAQKSA